jgi:hypothetical protein
VTRFLSALICATLLQLPTAAEPAPAEPQAVQEAVQEAQTEALATEAQNPISTLVSSSAPSAMSVRIGSLMRTN